MHSRANSASCLGSAPYLFWRDYANSITDYRHLAFCARTREVPLNCAGKLRNVVTRRRDEVLAGTSSRGSESSSFFLSRKDTRYLSAVKQTGRRDARDRFSLIHRANLPSASAHAFGKRVHARGAPVRQSESFFRENGRQSSRRHRLASVIAADRALLSPPAYPERLFIARARARHHS